MWDFFLHLPKCPFLEIGTSFVLSLNVRVCVFAPDKMVCVCVCVSYFITFQRSCKAAIERNKTTTEKSLILQGQGCTGAYSIKYNVALKTSLSSFLKVKES